MYRVNVAKMGEEENKRSRETLKVFFDGSCPLCRLEVSFYQNRKSSAPLEFVDISVAQANYPTGLNRTLAMARFHVLSKERGLISGARAFSELWKRIPGWKTVGYITSLPGLSLFFEGIYRLFLVWRPQIVKLFLEVQGRSKS